MNDLLSCRGCSNWWSSGKQMQHNTSYHERKSQPLSKKEKSWYHSNFGFLSMALDTIGNCQIPKYQSTNSVYMYLNIWYIKITNLRKIWTQLVVKVAREEWSTKKNLVAQPVCFQMPWIRDLSWGLEFNLNILVRNYFFLKNYVTSEGAVSHNVLYYQQLSIARCQVSIYANNYLE